MKLFNLLSLSLCCLLASCSTVLRSNIRLNRFDSAEAVGTKKGQFYAQTSRTARITHVPDIDEDPPRLSAVSINHRNSWGAGWTHGLAERWDVQLSYPWGLSTKFQLLGASREKAKAGNFSLAVGIGANVMESVADDVEFDEDSNRGEMDLTLADAALMAGWRPWEVLLLNASVFAQNADGRGKLQTENKEKFRLRQNGTIKGWSAGLSLMLGKSIVLSGDYTRSDVHWSHGADNQSFDSFAGRVAIRY
jgi:hypothetical protein